MSNRNKTYLTLLIGVDGGTIGGGDIMTTWICEICGAEFEFEENTVPIECPECGGVSLKIKPPAPPDELKIRP